MLPEVLATFSTQVRGIKFYRVSTESIVVGGLFTCHLEPFNLNDPDAICLRMSSPQRMLKHIARETGAHLAPLLRLGFEASG